MSYRSLVSTTQIIPPATAPIKVLDLTAKAHEVKDIYPSDPVLLTYPKDLSTNPIPLNWNARTPQLRGPIVCSHRPSQLGQRNAIGAHSGSYSIYRALAMALNTLDKDHKPDYTNTEPSFIVKPNEAWFDGRICTLDPMGHLVQTEFKNELNLGQEIRPTIALTRAHIKMAELDSSHHLGTLHADGRVVQKSAPRASFPDEKAGVEVNVSKVAVEPVWFLPGMAERFGIKEELLRRCLFEETGGMYPDLLTRPDLKAFLPPIGSTSIMIFGPPSYLSDPTKELTVRVHDECNGSDVFGSDICTCRPYLIYGIEEAIKCAQRGGVGLVVYMRKEGRALGETLKCTSSVGPLWFSNDELIFERTLLDLVYNSRKRAGDTADKYFAATENIAGVKDMRFQALMPDVLHWLGVKKIDNMISMSDMKYDAIVNSGIPIQRRYELPAELLPPDSQVEIDAKIAAGYFSEGKQVRVEDLHLTVGRAWEDLEH